MKAVSVHCGNHHVHGKARKYPYFVASLFVADKTRDGRFIWRYAGVHTKPRRSLRRAEEDARILAIRHAAALYAGRGSLHNKSAPDFGGDES